MRCVISLHKKDLLAAHINWSACVLRFVLSVRVKSSATQPAQVSGRAKYRERNAEKYVKLQRADNARFNAEFRTKLADRGMIFNDADTSSFRPRLASYYARWKDTVGQEAWTLLEGHVGKLG